MDPLSVISGVAGIGTAGAAIASALFNLISSMRDAPREMKDIAYGVQDLSHILHELRNTLRRGKVLFKDRLIRSIKSTIDRIRDLHEDIYGLLDAGDGGLARLKWTFSRSRTSKLLKEVEAHKSTINLMATTVLLAIKERKFTRRGGSDSNTKEDDAERHQLRREAETLVQVTHHRMGDLCPGKQQEDKGTQTHVTSVIQSSGDAHQEAEETHTTSPEQFAKQIERWSVAPDDMASWLYNLVFKDTQMAKTTPRTSADLSLPDQAFPTISLLPGVVDQSSIINRFLFQWTLLTPYEIENTQSTVGVQNQWEDRLAQAVQLLHIEKNDSESDVSTSSESSAPRMATPHNIVKDGESMDSKAVLQPEAGPYRAYYLDQSTGRAIRPISPMTAANRKIDEVYGAYPIPASKPHNPRSRKTRTGSETNIPEAPNNGHSGAPIDSAALRREKARLVVERASAGLNLSHQRNSKNFRPARVDDASDEDDRVPYRLVRRYRVDGSSTQALNAENLSRVPIDVERFSDNAHDSRSLAGNFNHMR